MKTFDRFLDERDEEVLPLLEQTSSPTLDNSDTVDEINDKISDVIHKPFPNVYSAIDALSQILQQYGIDLPTNAFQDEEQDEVVFAVKQFTALNTLKNDNTNYEHFIYLYRELNDDGTYDVFCALVNEEGLEELLEINADDHDDYDDDVE